MKRTIIFPVLCMFLFLTMGFLGCGEDETVFSAYDQKGKQIEFTTKISPDQYADLVKKFNIETDEINFQIGEFSGGYTLKSKDIDKELQDAKNTFVDNMSNILKLSEVSTDKDLSELRQSIQDAKKAALQGSMLFSGASVHISSEILSEMSQKGIIVNPSDDKVIQNSGSTMAPESSNHEPWAPYQGDTQVSRNYTYNTFYFNNVSAFNSNSTYEHETHLLTGYATYGGSWSSNLPRAYKDTQFGDQSGIDNFTVGCAQASSIQPYKNYCTYMALNPGNKATSSLRIKGQIGKRLISWIYSTWNIYSVATTYPNCMYTGTAPMSGVCWSY